MSQTHWFQVSSCCYRLETMSINVYKQWCI